MSEQHTDSEEIVKNFYSGGGWSEDDEGVTTDANLFEDLREVAADYVSKCRLRVLRHIPESGENMLDMASGPIQYREYLEYSRGFQKRHCVDLSSEALASAEQKIGEHGAYYNESFFDSSFDSDYFDCSISLHTIYHMDRDRQEEAVRKLIDVTKRDAPVIIVYSNPNAFPGSLLRLVKKVLRRSGEPEHEESSDTGLYFYVHDIKWWSRFKDVASVRVYPWRSFSTPIQKRLFPNNFLGRVMLSTLFMLEDRLSKISYRFVQYPMIVLVKR